MITSIFSTTNQKVSDAPKPKKNKKKKKKLTKDDADKDEKI